MPFGFCASNPGHTIFCSCRVNLFCLSSFLSFAWQQNVTNDALSRPLSTRHDMVTMANRSHRWALGQHVLVQGQGQGQWSSRSRPRRGPVVFKVKAKDRASGLRGQGQGQGQWSLRSRPRTWPVVIEVNAKDRASGHRGQCQGQGQWSSTSMPRTWPVVCDVKAKDTTTTTTTVLWSFFRDQPGEPVPEQNFFMVQGKINRGRNTDHPAGRHSVRTNQCPPPPSPHFFTGRMPFLPPNQQCQSTEGNQGQ